MKSPIQYTLAALENSDTSQKKVSSELGISQSYFSDILRGKRSFSKSVTKKLKIWLLKQGISAEELEQSFAIYEEAFFSNTTWERAVDLYLVKTDDLHECILSFAKVESYSPTPSWIAEKLGCSPAKVEEALARCIRLGYLNELGELAPKKIFNRTKDQIASMKRNRITNAIESLEKVPMELRNVSCTIFACDSKKLPVAKRLISEFTEKLTQLSNGAEDDIAYTFSFQLFPVKVGK